MTSSSGNHIRPRIRYLGTVDYQPCFESMRQFTDSRDADSEDEIWLLEHPPVFTQGQAGRAEHILGTGDIPVVASDRGGQVTYHGPGQLVAYVMVNLHRQGIGVRGLVTRLEECMVVLLADYGISAQARRDAPGVYVERSDWPDGHGQPEERKIGSLGLRVRRGCSYHGLSLNVNMDLSPFARINPCGYAGLRMTQVSDLGGPQSVSTVMDDMAPLLQRAFSVPSS